LCYCSLICSRAINKSFIAQEVGSSVEVSSHSLTSTPSTSVLESDSSRASSSFYSRPSSSTGFRPHSSVAMLTPSEQENIWIPSKEISCESGESSTALSAPNHSFSVECNPSVDLIEIGLNMFRNVLPKPWVPIADKEGFHLVLCSVQTPKAIQREIFISYNGNVHILFHCKAVPNFFNLFQLESRPRVGFNEHSVGEYCDVGLTLVKTFLQFEACVGADDLEAKHIWDKFPETVIDYNPYKEERYTETCRSVSCSLIIRLRQGKRCHECSKVKRSISKRREFLNSVSADPCTRNSNLTYEQAMKKLEDLHQSIRKKDKQIAYLQSRIIKILESEGVHISEDLNESFTRIIMASESLTDIQKMFLQEQWSSAHKSSSKSHVWHPTMIRLALNIYMRGTNHYNSVRDLGVIRLPHARTLFDYAHSIQAKGGINEELVRLVAERVEQLNEPHKDLHVLMCDGIHVSQNLVYRVSDGELVGYAHLDEIDKELERLDKYIQGKDPINTERQLATEVLAYLVKGMASDVKCVIASYPMKVMTKEMLYRHSWNVIRHLETAGVKILAFICDGHPVNRSFFDMHVPYTTDTKFKVIFDTVNFCASEYRLLFFISDLCHLLKTLRNSFYNSGDGPKKPRKLELNGERILWKFIVRLYFTFRNHTFRKSFKLSALNVFPNSYTKMKVLPAAQVLSNTVGQDLEDQKWPGTTETIKFIRYCNRFFDCLNGAHSIQSKRKRNSDLAPYTVENIEYELMEGRFKFLRGFIDYLAEWRDQIDFLPLHSSVKSRMYLPMQTMIGIEMTIRGIEAATVYFLDPLKGKGTFLNARIFSQDPLEHHFGDQRAGCGGSRNPNVAKFQQKQVATALQRGISVKKRKSNSAEEGSGLQLTTDPVPKKKRKLDKK